MQVRVKWLDNMTFVAESGSGHTVVMDGPPDAGGRNLAARPMEMVLVGLGGCSAYDVVSMLKKSRQDISACEVQINAERVDEIPKVFKRIQLHFVIKGKNLTNKTVARAVNLSAEKYCSVSRMLEKSAEIDYDYEIIDEADE